MLSPLPILSLLSTVAVLAYASIKRIPEGQVYTLRRLDGHSRLLGAGTHLILPLLERVTRKISLIGNVIAFDATPLPLDGSRRLHGLVYFQVLDPARAEAVVEGVDELVRAHTLALFGDADLATPEDAKARNLQLKAVLNQQLRERGLLVTRVQLSLG